MPAPSTGAASRIARAQPILRRRAAPAQISSARSCSQSGDARCGRVTEVAGDRASRAATNAACGSKSAATNAAPGSSSLAPTVAWRASAEAAETTVRSTRAGGGEANSGQGLSGEHGSAQPDGAAAVAPSRAAQAPHEGATATATGPSTVNAPHGHRLRHAADPASRRDAARARTTSSARMAWVRSGRTRESLDPPTGAVQPPDTNLSGSRPTTTRAPRPARFSPDTRGSSDPTRIARSGRY